MAEIFDNYDNSYFNYSNDQPLTNLSETFGLLSCHDDNWMPNLMEFQITNKQSNGWQRARAILGRKWQGEAQVQQLNTGDHCNGIGDVNRSQHSRKFPKNSKYCPFCKKNGAAPKYFYSHNLRNVEGQLECPILRAYVCPLCGKTGDLAHTESYCPTRPIGTKSVSRCVKSTPRNSTGLRNTHRYHQQTK